MNFQIQGTELQVGGFTFRVNSIGHETYAVRTTALYGENLNIDYGQYDSYHYIYDENGESAIWKNEAELLNAIDQDKFRFGVCIANKVNMLDYQVKFYDENENEIKV